MHSHVDNDTIIALERVGLLRGNRTILRDVNLTVNTGDFLAITGPNGGGKTSLLRIILGLLRPTAGDVYVRPGVVTGYLPQKNMIDSRFPLTVREVVASGLLGRSGVGSEEREALTAGAIAMVGMESHAASPIGNLSGGQLQRALLARAIICRPALLALDEPLSYIDKRFEQRFYDLVEELSRSATILLVSHEMSGLSAMTTRTLYVDGGIKD